MKNDKLIRVTATYAVGGVVARDGRIVKTAPILHKTMGMDAKQFDALCKREGWTWELVQREDRHAQAEKDRPKRRHQGA